LGGLQRWCAPGVVLGARGNLHLCWLPAVLLAVKRSVQDCSASAGTSQPILRVPASQSPRCPCARLVIGGLHTDCSYCLDFRLSVFLQLWGGPRSDALVALLTAVTAVTADPPSAYTLRFLQPMSSQEHVTGEEAAAHFTAFPFFPCEKRCGCAGNNNPPK
jgi:hypothetical protein